MKTLQRWQLGTSAALMALLLAACGGGGNGSSDAITPAPVVNPTPTPAPVETGAPAVTGNIATDGLNWLNFRRQQAGLSVLPRNGVIDSTAAGHSNYQKLNTITHEQEVGKPGFTGRYLLDRLTASGYANPDNYFYGEVISAGSSSSGVSLAEELITAIYHRFAIFEPRFKEIGAGVASKPGYNILTVNFAANGGYGAGLGAGKIATWPTDGKTGVVHNFFSDYEAPDPVAGTNEVGYPVSVHADADVVLKVSSFTIRPRGGATVAVRLLSHDTDTVNMEKNNSAAAIVPLQPLAKGTLYDVSFVGTGNGIPISKNWSFTTAQ